MKSALIFMAGAFSGVVGIILSAWVGFVLHDPELCVLRDMQGMPAEMLPLVTKRCRYEGKP